MLEPTIERLIDKLRNELYNKYHWIGEDAVKFMVPIILAIRQKDTGPEEDSIVGAWQELVEGGKRELDDTLVKVRTEHHGVSELLRKTIDDMIQFIGRQPEGIILDILTFLGERDAHDRHFFLLALRDDDFIGSLFERSVSNAFRGDDGRFYTPRNIILIMRELMRLLLLKEQPGKKISEYSVCDPCCGSARFLIYWSELIKNEIQSELGEEAGLKEVAAHLRSHAERTLFGADIHSDTSDYGRLNMLLHGDGASNITTHNSLDHFGFFADIPLLREFATEFAALWPEYNREDGPARRNDDLRAELDTIDARKAILDQLLSTDQINFSDPSIRWMDVMHVLYALLRADRGYSTGWDTLHKIQRSQKHRSVLETMLNDWNERNVDVSNGFQILISNPPFGRQPELMVKEPHILCQYRLATEWWVGDMPKGRVEELLRRTLAKDIGLAALYIQLVNERLDKTHVAIEDEVRFNKLSTELLVKLAIQHRVSVEDHIEDITDRLRGRLRKAIREQLSFDRAQLDRDAVDYKGRERYLREEAQDELEQAAHLSLSELRNRLDARDVIWQDVLSRDELAGVLSKVLDRVFITEEDNLLLDQLPPSEVVRVSASHLYEENGKPGDVLAGEISRHFGKEWLSVEDIEGPDGYASKVTLLFNGQPHTIYYDAKSKPIVYRTSLPKQVLFIEQFLRMVKGGGKVFTVLDTGVLSNLSDEYVRRFIYANAKVHAIVEFPHGAFKAADANVKTAVILLEKGEFEPDYSFFGALPEYLGYKLNDKNVPLIRQNDLGKVLCDYSVHLGFEPLLNQCSADGACVDACTWYEDRNCSYWRRAVEKVED